MSVARVIDGYCHPIPPSEILAWCQLSGSIVYPKEYDILRAMDDVYCDEKNVELQDYQARRDAERKKEAEASKRKRGK